MISKDFTDSLVFEMMLYIEEQDTPPFSVVDVCVNGNLNEFSIQITFGAKIPKCAELAFNFAGNQFQYNVYDVKRSGKHLMANLKYMDEFYNK